MVPFSGGIKPLYPGKPEAASVMIAMPFLWGLRPVSRHDRVGEHSAVVWKFVYVRPRSWIRRMLGISTRPPYTSQAPNPVSSQTT